MDTNYKLTSEHHERAKRMAETLWAQGKGDPKGVALAQAAQHPADGLAAAFWQCVAQHAEAITLFCGQLPA
jgi:hypothetical protein